MGAQKLTMGQKARLLQLDRAVFVLAITCGLPLFVHAIPITGGLPMGAVWLPIFYAPLLAVFFCRPHVALTSALLAPAINHVFFGQPDGITAEMLTTELVFFVLFARIIFSRWPRFSGSGVVAYLGASFVSKVFLSGGTFTFGDLNGIGMFFSRAGAAWPGLLVLLTLGFLSQRMKRKENAERLL